LASIGQRWWKIFPGWEEGQKRRPFTSKERKEHVAGLVGGVRPPEVVGQLVLVRLGWVKAISLKRVVVFDAVAAKWFLLWIVLA
jgi:hypothetical protein